MMVGGSIVKLHENNKHLETLEQAIIDLLYERGEGLPFPTILGILRLVEYRLVKDTDALP